MYILEHYIFDTYNHSNIKKLNKLFAYLTEHYIFDTCIRVIVYNVE